MKKKVVVFGKNGQLASELRHELPNSIECVFFASSECDITDHQKVAEVVEANQPEVVINATAYTKVDIAESEPESCYQVNHLAVENLGKLCAAHGARLIHVSTDFVFDGQANQPYKPENRTNPLGVYGASKLAGEEALRDTENLDYLIIRTAWVYSVHGNNFVKTMLRLMQSKDCLNVVDNQLGSPTWAKGLAAWIWALVTNEELNIEENILHWTDLGAASWYDFAVYIQNAALQKGLLSKKIPIKPISDSQYPTPAERPKYSVLDKERTLSISPEYMRHWTENLEKMIAELEG